MFCPMFCWKQSVLRSSSRASGLIRIIITRSVNKMSTEDCAPSNVKLDQETVSNTKGNDMPPLPAGMRIPDHQVTGHFYGAGRTKMGLLECEDGTIVKPCQSPPRGVREMKFYQSVFDAGVDEPMVLGLRKIVPNYLGMLNTELHPDVNYIKLENITYKLNNPCIIDVKMGQRSYDPEASLEKIRKESIKYPPQMKIGFRISGMRVYDIDTLSYKMSDKKVLITYTPKEVLTLVFASFISAARKMAPCVIVSFLKKLLKIRSWFHCQKKFAFYSSSLLMVYEGDILKYPPQPCQQCTKIVHECKTVVTTLRHSHVKATTNGTTAVGSSQNLDNEIKESTCKQQKLEQHCSKNGCVANKYSFVDDLPVSSINDIENVLEQVMKCEICDELTDVRMIDFAHVFSASDIDAHYLYGLNNIIAYFIELLLTVEE